MNWRPEFVNLDCTKRVERFRQAIAWTALLAVALGIRVGFAIRRPNLFHPDEIFQTLEPAHRLAYGYGIITWEWRMGIRSWVLPAFLAGIMRCAARLSAAPEAYLYAIVVTLSILSLTTVWFAYAWAKRVRGETAAILAAVACAIYFGMIYFAPKALNEVIAAHVLLPGLYLGVYADKIGEKKRMLFAGVFCGLAASLRIQLIPALVYALVFFCYPRWRQRIPALFAGLALPVIAFGVVDWFTWSYPFQSFFGYFKANLIEGRSLEFGEQPWYWYLLVILALLGPAILFLWQGVRRSPFLAIFSLIVLVSHSMISHKEFRFLYPILPLMLILASIGFVESASSLMTRLNRPASERTTVAAGLIFLVISSAICSLPLSFKWRFEPGGLYAADLLSADSSLCGLGVFQMKWWSTGGYTHLHRNVPIIPMQNTSELLKNSPAFDAFVAPIEAKNLLANFTLAECKDGICLYRRAGACALPQKDQIVNEYLQNLGR
jgi:hypothetical protein